MSLTSSSVSRPTMALRKSMTCVLFNLLPSGLYTYEISDPFEKIIRLGLFRLSYSIFFIPLFASLTNAPTLLYVYSMLFEALSLKSNDAYLFTSSASSSTLIILLPERAMCRLSIFPCIPSSLSPLR